MKKLLLPFIIALAAITCTVSCKKKDDGSGTNANPSNIDPKDRNAVTAVKPSFTDLDGQEVSSKLTINNATRMTDQIPSPDPDGPVLYDDSEAESIRAANGKNIVLELYSDTYVEGVYLQIDGATDYFDIDLTDANTTKKVSINPKKSPFKSKAHLKTAQSSTNLEIELPESLGQGKFCVSYCIYNSVEGISNIVTRCVEIQSLGGNASLVGEWDFKNATLFTDGEILTIYKGKSWNYPYNTGEQLYDDCFSKDKYVINDFVVSLMANGTETEYTSSNDEYYTIDENNNCILDEEYSGQMTETTNGYWSYDNSVNTLTLIEEYDEYGYNDFIDFKVNQSGSNLTLSWLEEDEDFFFSFIYNFEKK